MSAEQIGVLAGQVIVILGGTHWGQRVLQGRVLERIDQLISRIAVNESEIRRAHDRIDNIYAIMGLTQREDVLHHAAQEEGPGHQG